MDALQNNQPLKRVSRAILLDDQGRACLGKRARSDAAGQWALIGGKPDGGETAEQAIIREVKEELGIEFRPKFFKEVEDKIPQEPRAWRVTFFSGTIEGRLKPDPREVSDIIFVAADNLESLDITFNHRQVLEEFFKQRK